MILYGSPPSPFVRKVSIVIEQLGLTEHIELRSPKVLPYEINQDYFKLVPLGKIPALMLESGLFVHDSLVICDYLNEYGNGSLIATGLLPRTAMLTRHSIASGAADAAVSMRYEVAARPEAMQWSQWIDGQSHKVFTAIEWFEKNLPTSTDLMQLDSIALACFLGYLDFRFADQGWRAIAPQLANWFDEVDKSNVMMNTSPKA